MSSDTAISVEHVSKRYNLREPRVGLQGLASELKRMLVKRESAEAAQAANTFYALRDVAFRVKHGEALGIIGHNGAGKTTTLKLLSGITKPTSGQLQLDGRFSSLIELGAGFHPDLTGRENVELNGVILGLSRNEVRRKFDEIVGFAELEKFIDMPVKRYSSGMYARLGFAVAAHVDPDIMLVDEVLAVGDASFQQRCYNFIANFVKSGRTTVFISHNLYVVEQLCSRVIWLDHGQIRAEGTPSTVLSAYLDDQDQRAKGDVSDALAIESVTDRFRLNNIVCKSVTGDLKDTFTAGEDLVISATYSTKQPIEHPHFVFVVVDSNGGKPLFLASMLADGRSPTVLQGEGELKCVFKNLPLQPRSYFVWGEVWSADRKNMLVNWQRMSAFQVTETAEQKRIAAEVGASIRHTRADAPIRVDYEWKY